MRNSPSNVNPRCCVQKVGEVFTHDSLLKFKPIVDIDEVSPSEEEDAAQQALHNTSLNQDKWNDMTDVLSTYRARNRSTKPPNEQRLLDAAKLQLQDVSDNGNSNDQDEEEEEEEEEEENTPRIRAPRNSKSDGTISPQTAKYYSDCWKEAIERAKERFRRFIILHNLFPDRDNHLQDAATILSKIVADEKSTGKPFNASTYFLPFIRDFILLYIYLYRLYANP
jgi:hypothetical protein